MPNVERPVSCHCMGCGAALARCESLLGEPVRCAGGRDATGAFFRCPVCGGRSYYAVREGSGLVFVAFRAGASQGDPAIDASHPRIFLRCMGAALAVLGAAKFVSEVVAETLLPYPPVALFTAFLGWAVLYVVSVVRHGGGEDLSRVG